MLLGVLQDLSLYAEHRYGGEIPRDMAPSMTAPVRGFFSLVRKRIDEIAADRKS